jgi:hypothetical protein
MSERAAELGISPQKIEPQSEANEGPVGPGRLLRLRSRVATIRVQPNLLPAPARTSNNRQGRLLAANNISFLVVPLSAVKPPLLLSFSRTPRQEPPSEPLPSTNSKSDVLATQSCFYTRDFPAYVTDMARV